MNKVAILGYGVVGAGVAQVLAQNEHRMRSGHVITLGYILDVRAFPDSPYADKFITDFNIILQDTSCVVVVETIGGATHALEFTKRALMAGKSVVTSNKELVAQHGHELLTLAHQHGCDYLFEASVGGGIPIIRPMGQCLLANDILEVFGILNGTTNYILTQMFQHGVAFDKALQQAQALGYAERNPSDDISGKDVCRKICILSSLAFGTHVYPSDVETQGIEDITPEDVSWAEHHGYAIKLLGRAVALEDGHITAYVAPHLVPKEHPLSTVSDVYNGIMVCGDAIGDVMFYGRGAGRLPTASAVVADVIDAVKHRKAPKTAAWAAHKEGFVMPPSVLSPEWYVRDLGLRDAAVDGHFCMRVLEA